jgi:hypothetical protein
MKTATVAKGPGAGESFPDSGRAERSECGAREGAKIAKGRRKGHGIGTSWDRSGPPDPRPLTLRLGHER